MSRAIRVNISRQEAYTTARIMAEHAAQRVIEGVAPLDALRVYVDLMMRILDEGPL